MIKYRLADIAAPFPSWFSFTRNVTTVTPDGLPIAAGQVRLNAQRTLAGTWGAEDQVNWPSTDPNDPNPNRVIILAAGRAANGKDPLLVCRRDFNNRIEIAVLSGTGLTLLSNVPYFPDRRGSTSSIDISQNAFANSRAFEPVSGVVCFGTVVLACLVKEIVGPGWVIRGSGIVSWAIQDGTPAMWSRYFTDTVNPANPSDPMYFRQQDKMRVEAWSVENWYCPLSTTEDPPTEIIVPIADYRFAPQNRADAKPEGGRVFWFKMTKDAQGVYRPLVVGTQPAVGVYTLDVNAYDDAYTHFHAAGVLKYGTDKWQVVIAVGDGNASSNIRIAINDVSNANYFNQANWTVKVNSYGTIDTNIVDGNGVRPSPRPPAIANNSNPGNQFVGVAPGPDKDSLLVGSDAVGEALHIMRYPSTNIANPPTHETVVSEVATFINNGAFFTVRTDEPHKNTRTVVATCENFRDDARRPYAPSNLSSIAVSRESGLPGTWSHLPLRGSSNEPDPQRYQNNVFVVGDYLYLHRVNASGLPTSIVRRKLPIASFSGRPLLVGPGGSQWLVDSPRIEGTPGVMQCARDGNLKWLTKNMNGEDGLPLSPQPPVKVDAAFRMTAVRGAGQFLCSLYPGRSSSQAAAPVVPTTTPGSSVFRMRAWLKANSALAADSPQRAAGRSASGAGTDILWNGGTRNGDSGFVEGVFNHGTEGWSCVTAYTSNGREAGFAERWNFLAKSQGTESDTDFYIAISEFQRGEGAFGYPLPARNSNDQNAAVFGPEVAEITGLALNKAWTVFAGGLTPEDSWDQYVPTLTQNERTFPLFTLIDASGKNYITVRAFPTEIVYPESPLRPSCLEVAVTVDGIGTKTFYTAEAVFLRGRPFQCALTHDFNDVLKLYAVVNGDFLPILTMNIVFGANVTLTKLRFGDHQTGSDFKVGAFQWMGVATDSTTFSPAGVRSQFETLGYL